MKGSELTTKTPGVAAATPAIRPEARCNLAKPDHPCSSLRADPDWIALGDMAADTARGLAAVAHQENRMLQEAFRDRMQSIADAAAGPDPSPLERLLADRIGLCWGHLSFAESDYLRRLNDGGSSLELSDFLDRHRDHAHRRYLQAIKALAQVRKLLGPAVTQVNIAENQVNVAG